MSKQSIIDTFMLLSEEARTVGKLKQIIRGKYQSVDKDLLGNKLRDKLRDKLGTDNKERYTINDDILDEIIQSITPDSKAASSSKVPLKVSAPKVSARKVSARKVSASKVSAPNSKYPPGFEVSSSKLASSSKVVRPVARDSARFLSKDKTFENPTPRIVDENQANSSIAAAEARKRSRENSPLVSPASPARKKTKTLKRSREKSTHANSSPVPHVTKKTDDISVYVTVNKYKKYSIIDRNEFEKKTCFGSKNVIIFMLIFDFLCAVKSNDLNLFTFYKNKLQHKILQSLKLGDNKVSFNDDIYKKYHNNTLESCITIDKIKKTHFVLKLTQGVYYDKLADLNKKYKLYEDRKNIGQKDGYYYFSCYTQYLRFLLAYNYFTKSEREDIVLDSILTHINIIIADNSSNEYYKMLLIKIINKVACCYICGFKIPDSHQSQIDHIIPEAVAWITGVIHTPFNYEYTHQPCNGSKSATLPIGIESIVIDKELESHLIKIDTSFEFNESVLESYSDMIFQVFSKLPSNLQTQENYNLIVERARGKFQSGGRRIYRGNPSIKIDKLITKTPSILEELYILLDKQVIDKNIYAIGILLEVIKYFTLIKDIKSHKSDITYGGNGADDPKIFDKIQAYFKTFSNENTINRTKLSNAHIPLSECDTENNRISHMDQRLRTNASKANPYCMMDVSRANYYVNRVIVLNEFSNHLYNAYKLKKEANYSYTDFIRERFQKLTNFKALPDEKYYD